MKTSSTFSTLACAILIGAAFSSLGRAETIFTQDFENGLGANESVFGRFSINDTLPRELFRKKRKQKLHSYPEGITASSR